MFDNLADQNRIDFLLERDTPEEVLTFAVQCVRQYRVAVIASKRKHGKRGAFREKYISSYLFHKQYVLENQSEA